MSSRLRKKVQLHAGLLERWELRYWQQIWQANLMTSHLHLRKEKKQTSTPASSLLRGIWKHKLHQTSNASNESNWEKVCPGSEGCEEVVEREQLLCRSGGREREKERMEGGWGSGGAVEAPRARKLKLAGWFRQSKRPRRPIALIPLEHFKSLFWNAVRLNNSHHRIDCTPPDDKNTSAWRGENTFLASGV